MISNKKHWFHAPVTDGRTAGRTAGKHDPCMEVAPRPKNTAKRNMSNAVCSPALCKLGRGDFQKIFRIFFATSVGSWVTELWWKIMILGLKKNFSPWKKFQFSREIIYKGGKFNKITKVNINKNINVKLRLLELLSDWIFNILHIFSFGKALIGLLYAQK